MYSSLRRAMPYMASINIRNDCPTPQIRRFPRGYNDSQCIGSPSSSRIMRRGNRGLRSAELPVFRPGWDQTQIRCCSCSQTHTASVPSYASPRGRSHQILGLQHEDTPCRQKASLLHPSRHCGVDTIGGIQPQTVSPHRPRTVLVRMGRKHGEQTRFFLASWGEGTSAHSPSTMGAKRPHQP